MTKFFEVWIIFLKISSLALGFLILLMHQFNFYVYLILYEKVPNEPPCGDDKRF